MDLCRQARDGIIMGLLECHTSALGARNQKGRLLGSTSSSPPSSSWWRAAWWESCSGSGRCSALMVLVRPPGVGISRPGARLAGASSPSAFSSGWHLSSGRSRRQGKTRIAGDRDALSPGRLRHSLLLPARPFLYRSHQFHCGGQLALLDHPSLGGRVLRTLRHDDGCRPFLQAGHGPAPDRHEGDLPRRDPLPWRAASSGRGTTGTGPGSRISPWPLARSSPPWRSFPSPF